MSDTVRVPPSPPTPLVDAVVATGIGSYGVPHPNSPYLDLAKLARTLERDRAELMEALRDFLRPDEQNRTYEEFSAACTKCRALLARLEK